MIVVTQYKNKTVGVFGLGKSGEATIASLVAGGAKVVAWDDNQNSIAKVEAAYNNITQPIKDWPWKELETLVLSPGVPLTHPKPHEVVVMAKEHNVPIIGDIELLYHACPKARYIGITGTNGKSTTTALIGHILNHSGGNAEVGGNIGVPVLALKPLAEFSSFVLETSSYQLDLLKTAKLNVACLLNITPDHLDRHGDMEQYIAAKKHIFDRQTKSDIAIIAIDDAHTRALAAELIETGKQQVVTVSTTGEANIFVRDGILHHGDVRLDLKNITTLIGAHNWQNAAIAYAVAYHYPIVPDKIYAAMKSFPGLKHRLQSVAMIQGVRFINDSKATNADAVSHALAPYENIYWILGGKAKSGGIESLEAFFPRVAHAFLIGEAAELFAKTFMGKVEYSHCATLDNAVISAANMAWNDKKKNAVVLLSPACASFDQFKSFEHRGDVFCELVERLQIEHTA